MSTKMKKHLIRLSRVVMIALLLTNIAGIVLNNVYADFGVGDILEGTAWAGLNVAMVGLPLIIVTGLKLIIVIVGLVGHAIMGGAMASMGGSFTGDLDQIVFAGADGKCDFLNVNFFATDGGNMIRSFRGSVAKWYYILRLISAAILLVVLIYVGIRMALSTVAQEQAKYKQMLVDWVTSLALLFLLHYIIIFVIQVNEALVKGMATLIGSEHKDPLLSTGAGARVIWAVRNRRNFCRNPLCYDDWSNVYVFLTIHQTFNNSRLSNYDCAIDNDYLFN